MQQMKFFNSVAAAFVAAASFSVAPITAQSHKLPTVEERFAPGADIIVVAHRGCHAPMPLHGRGSAPENSLLALDRCVEAGVDVMETDVLQSADGHLVMIHDDTVDRTTDRSGRVAQMTPAELRRLRLREDLGGAKAPLTDQRILTLEEMLAYARGRMLLNLDIKASIYPQVIESVRRAGASQYVFVKTEVGITTQPLAGVAPFDQVPFMPILLNAEGKADFAAILDRQLSGLRPIGVELPKLSESQLAPASAAAKRHDVRLMLNTLGEGFLPSASDRDALRSADGVWGRLAAAGVSVFQTDEPEALVEYRKGRHRERTR